MKERTTFIHESDVAFDPSQLHISNDSLHIKSLQAARESRLTVNLYDLPQELWRALKQSHELHIRWTSSHPNPLVTPFSSNLPPGLHLFFTPQTGQSTELLCPLLRKVFGNDAKCISPEDTFTKQTVVSERFSSSATYQFHAYVPSLDDLVIYIFQKICAGDSACRVKAESLTSADYFDFDYDAISQAVTLSAFWHPGLGSGAQDYQIDNKGGSIQTEVGILANEKPTTADEVSLGGFLVVLGKDEKPSPALFSFPSRHHLLSSPSYVEYVTEFVQPTGLHPVLRLPLPYSLKAPAPECALHTYFTLPSSLFVDKYQLSSPNFLASKNLRSVRSLSGETDLEAPDWAISRWGSAMLLELSIPTLSSKLGTESTWHADVPLHHRYLPPSVEKPKDDQSSPRSQSGQRNLSVPWPVVFWACPSDEGTKMNTNPFDRVNLGYDGLFGPRTMFYHLQPSTSVERLVEELSVPVMDLSDTRWMEFGTVSVVSLGFLWVCWQLLRVVSKDSRSLKTPSNKND